RRDPNQMAPDVVQTDERLCRQGAACRGARAGARGDVMTQSRNSTWVLVAFAVAAATVFLAAQSTRAPGELTQARVWVENKAPFEPIPVSVEGFASTPSVRLSSVDTSVVLASRAGRQQWEYRIVPYDNGALVGAGNDGWEAVGVVASAGSPSVLLKR